MSCSIKIGIEYNLRNGDLKMILVLWKILVVIQGILSFGTAYRLTKKGGDNGLALWGWFIVFEFVSLVPGLGIYMWFKYKDE
jgi:hypothetical protein